MPVEIFCCYARKDQKLLQHLKAQLMPFQRQGLITLWSDTDINAGKEWDLEITKHLNASQIILLMVSPDFMMSEYIYSKEMKRALERHEQGEATVIPIILRWVSWQRTPLGELQALPKDGKPVKSWQDEDEAFYNVVEGIHKVVADLMPTPEDFSWHCILTFSGHEDSVVSVAISPDGQTLASGSDDKTIKLWEKK